MESQRMNYCIFLAVGILSVVTRADYPPPSEHGHSDYAGFLEPPFIKTSSYEDWYQQGAGEETTCIDMPSNLTLCQGVGYRHIRLPNLFGYSALKDVLEQTSSWKKLVSLNCHPDTQVFLCSLFAPVCLEQPIWPCRSMCEQVKRGCGSRMYEYGFPWPEMLHCDRFPLDNDLCISDIRNNGTSDPVVLCDACLQPNTLESFVDNFCSAHIVMRVKIKDSLISGKFTKIKTAKRKKVYKSVSMDLKQLRDASLYIENGATICECPHLEMPKETKNDFIVMGNTVNGSLVLTSIQQVDQINKIMKRAMRIIRKEGVCIAGVKQQQQKNWRENVKRKRGRRHRKEKSRRTPPNHRGGKKAANRL